MVGRGIKQIKRQTDGKMDIWMKNYKDKEASRLAELRAHFSDVLYPVCENSTWDKFIQNELP